jgi:cytochrome c biogenesis protein CcdA/thiol-disulfide isomerase/thioredoxin
MPLVALLIAFAVVAGAATAVSPCVLPVLPVVLSAGVTGGRRRPLGVVTGLALSFTFATVALVYVIDALGLPNDLVRTLAIVVLLGFGLALLIPRLGARLEVALSRLVPARARRRAGSGDGFGSGLVLGLSLGLVYAPCAGPILAGVITVSAAQSFTAGRLAVALAYGLGTAVALYVLMIGGRRLTRRLSGQSARLQLATGAVMVLVALLMLGEYDLRFQTAIADDLPALLVNPTKELEESAAAQESLADLRGDRSPDTRVRRRSAGDPLPMLGAAPDFAGTQRWFNTAGGRPLTLNKLRGHPVLVDFWTYTCINCIRTFPYLKAWDRRYRKAGLVIVGVHTPEFPFERDESNVRDAIAQNELRYPVVQDNDYAVWQAYQNQYWPASYFIDAEGQVRYVHFGEGDYEEKEQVIRELLREAGERPGARAGGRGEQASPGVTTPETYLGAARAERFANGEITAGTRDFEQPAELPPDHLGYGGRWRVGEESATAVAGPRLELDFGARRVYLVLGSRGGVPRAVKVLLDGRPISAGAAGGDVLKSVVRVQGQQLYELVNLPRVERHRLTLNFAPGVSGYAFTFG